MVLVFPFIEIDHEDDIRSCMVAFIDESSSPPSVISVRRAIHFFECLDFEPKVLGITEAEYNDRGIPIGIYGVNKKEYASRSGLHAVEPYNVKPAYSTSSYDFYIIEELGSFDLTEWVAKRTYVMPTAREEAFKKAVALYTKRAKERGGKFAEPTGAFLWRVRQGYRYVKLARDVGESMRDKFIKAAAEYVVLYVLQAV